MSNLSGRSRIARFFGGLAVVVIILVVAFALLPAWIHHWGATEEEIARRMPGDELLAAPTLVWTHGITIRARPQEVWPWIAQIGDDRGGFYSYTFIENLIDPEDRYHNANAIIAEFQNLQPGEGLIVDYLTVRAVEPGQYLLAQLADVPELGWTWIWHLYPSGEDATRLVVRMRIQPAATMDNPAVMFVVDVGGFVMERRMMQGIKDRAEGRFDPPAIEAVEIGLWVVALVVGLAGAVLFLVRKAWQIPLLIAVLAVLSLLAFTFLQPPIWIRALVDAVLLVGLIFFALAQKKRTKIILTVIASIFLLLLISGIMYYTSNLSNLAPLPENIKAIIPESPPNELHVLSYNVFLRPNAISSADYTTDRAKQIGQWLENANVDIVALQEAWEPDAVSLLVEEVSHELPYYVVNQPAKQPMKSTSGGLLILSRWPIEKTQTLVYDNCSGSDYQASKGAVHVVVRMSENSYLNFVTTHLDAGEFIEDRAARASQVEQLCQFIAEIDQNVGPTLVTGDFNIDSLADDGEYDMLVDTFETNFY